MDSLLRRHHRHLVCCRHQRVRSASVRGSGNGWLASSSTSSSSYSVFCHTGGPWQPNSPFLPILDCYLQVILPFLLKQIVNHTYAFFLALSCPLFSSITSFIFPSPLVPYSNFHSMNYHVIHGPFYLFFICLHVNICCLAILLTDYPLTTHDNLIMVVHLFEVLFSSMCCLNEAMKRLLSSAFKALCLSFKSALTFTNLRTSNTRRPLNTYFQTHTKCSD